MLDTQTDCNIEFLFATLAVNASKFAYGKLEHFILVMRTMLDSYQSDAKHGIVLVRDGAAEIYSMIPVAIDADSF